MIGTRELDHGEKFAAVEDGYHRHALELARAGRKAAGDGALVSPGGRRSKRADQELTPARQLERRVETGTT